MCSRFKMTLPFEMCTVWIWIWSHFEISKWRMSLVAKKVSTNTTRLHEMSEWDYVFWTSAASIECFISVWDEKKTIWMSFRGEFSCKFHICMFVTAVFAANVCMCVCVFFFVYLSCTFKSLIPFCYPSLFPVYILLTLVFSSIRHKMIV